VASAGESIPQSTKRNESERCRTLKERNEEYKKEMGLGRRDRRPEHVENKERLCRGKMVTYENMADDDRDLPEIICEDEVRSPSDGLEPAERSANGDDSTDKTFSESSLNEACDLYMMGPGIEDLHMELAARSDSKISFTSIGAGGRQQRNTMHFDPKQEASWQAFRNNFFFGASPSDCFKVSLSHCAEEVMASNNLALRYPLQVDKPVLECMMIEALLRSGFVDPQLAGGVLQFQNSTCYFEGHSAEDSYGVTSNALTGMAIPEIVTVTLSRKVPDLSSMMSHSKDKFKLGCFLVTIINDNDSAIEYEFENCSRDGKFILDGSNLVNGMVNVFSYLLGFNGMTSYSYKKKCVSILKKVYGNGRLLPENNVRNSTESLWISTWLTFVEAF
jgi:hypothetical protein